MATVAARLAGVAPAVLPYARARQPHSRVSSRVPSRQRASASSIRTLVYGAKAAHLRSRPGLPSGSSTRLPSRAGTVRASAIAAAETSAQLEEKLDSFWRWLVDGGAVNKDQPAVRPAVVSGPGGQRLALVAQRDIRVGEELFGVPVNMCLSLRTVQQSELGPFVPQLRPWVALALFILKEKHNPNSPWTPFLDTLASSSNSPLFWSEEELQMLEGSQLLAQQQQYQEYVAEEFAAVQEGVLPALPALFPPSHPPTLPDFTRAFACLRAHTFPPFNRDDITLVPLMHLLTHSESAPEGKWEQRSSGGLFGVGRQMLFASAVMPYARGSEVAVNFSKSKSNAQLAMDYGFVIRPSLLPAPAPAPRPVPLLVNPMGDMVSVGKAVAAVEAAAAAATAAKNTLNRDVFSLTLEISEEDKFFDDKADIAESNGLATVADFDIVPGQGVPDAMLAFLRLVALGGSDAFLLEALFRESAWDHVQLPVSRDNEEALASGLVEACKQALAAYPSTYQQDLALLPQVQAGSRQEVAVVVRAGEKAALLELQAWAQRRLLALDSLLYYAERRLKDLGLLDDKGDMTPWVPVE